MKKNLIKLIVRLLKFLNLFIKRLIGKRRYTGFRDCNDKKIFEGDFILIRNGWGRLFENQKRPHTSLHIVRRYKKEWCMFGVDVVNDEGRCSINILSQNWFEYDCYPAFVISNIYNSPELLSPEVREYIIHL